MDQRQRALNQRMRQIGIVAGQLIGCQHTLVDQRPRREAGDVERRAALLDPPPQEIEPPFEARWAVFSGADEDLLYVRLARFRAIPDLGVVLRHIAPAQHFETGFRDLRRDDIPALLRKLGILRHEEHPYPVVTGVRQYDAQFTADMAVKALWNLDQDAGAIAGRLLVAGRATVTQVLQCLEPLGNDFVRLASLYVDVECDATCVVLPLRVIESRSGRKPLTGVHLIG